MRLPSKVRHKLRPRQMTIARSKLQNKKRSCKVAVKVKAVKVKVPKVVKAAVAAKVDLDSVAVVADKVAAVVVEGWVHSVNL